MSNKTALCIGINNYPGTQNDLNGCVNDANDWAKELESRGFTVTLLLDAKAKKANIIKEMKKMLNATKEDDSVVIQYSGHGSYVPDENGDEADGKDECMCPHDIAKKNGENNFITDDELFDIYSLRHHKSRLVIISDSCHSGTNSRAAILLSPTKQPRKSRFLSPANFLSAKEMAKFGSSNGFQKASKPGRYAGLLMAGCQDSQVSYDAYFQDRPNGAFSFAALKALKELGKSPSATYNDWFKGIKKILPSQDYDQIPNLYGASTMKKWKVLA
ncbi:MAG: caspase family protein [Ferruginibacter sp.]